MRIRELVLGGPVLAALVLVGCAPPQPPPQARPVAVAAGWDHNCALIDDGSVWCWGANDSGQLGNGSTTDTATPTRVVGLDGKASSIAAGVRHTCAALLGGVVQCWGDNSQGQLGTAAPASSSTPLDVLRLNTGVIEISSGNLHSCAHLSDRSAKCWGSNDYAQLGDGAGTARPEPVDVIGLGGAISDLDAGGGHGCAVINPGAVKCWGENSYGQTGFVLWGIPTWSPESVSGLEVGVRSVDANGSSTCAVTDAGAVKCWGNNTFGQLGNGSNVSTSAPVDAFGLSGGTADVSLGMNHGCALSTAGGLRCWGVGTDGQLGSGSPTNSATPVEVLSLSAGVRSVAGGLAHTCAVTAAGRVKCWGRGSSGQLGNGSLTSSANPVDVSWLPGA
jgi:alpha-tubulin suppressor-like RCC1 family protein